MAEFRELLGLETVSLADYIQQFVCTVCEDDVNWIKKELHCKGTERTRQTDRER